MLMHGLTKVWLFGNLKKYKEAIECYDKAIEINPKYVNAWFNKGASLINLITQEILRSIAMVGHGILKLGNR